MAGTDASSTRVFALSASTPESRDVTRSWGLVAVLRSLSRPGRPLFGASTVSELRFKSEHHNMQGIIKQYLWLTETLTLEAGLTPVVATAESATAGANTGMVIEEIDEDEADGWEDDATLDKVAMKGSKRRDDEPFPAGVGVVRAVEDARLRVRSSRAIES